MKPREEWSRGNGVIRVIVDGPRDPQINMAIDESIARLRYKVGIDTLRIYMWKPTGVSIGRKQNPIEELNLDLIREKGYILVRRPTGGSALIHKEDGEITYSVVLSRSHELYKLDVASSASIIAKGIANTINRLGFNASIGSFKGLDHSNLCYVRSGSSDVVIKDKKISGSAQRRSWNVLLQHGTLLLDFNKDEWINIIKIENHHIKLLDNIIGLKQLIESNISLKEIIEVLINSMIEALGYRDYIYGSLTPDEIDLAWKLYRVKYSTDLWNIEGIDQNTYTI